MARSRTRGERERELPEAPPQNDVYTGLLIISLIATLTGLGFVAFDYMDYRGDVPKKSTPASISQPVEPVSPPPSAPQ
jgi:hypothetical protein